MSHSDDRSTVKTSCNHGNQPEASVQLLWLPAHDDDIREPIRSRFPRRRFQHSKVVFVCFRKAITTLAFSPDGKYVVTGEVSLPVYIRVLNGDRGLPY